MEIVYTLIVLGGYTFHPIGCKVYPLMNGDAIIGKFVSWTKLKVRIHLSEVKTPFFHEREIWWASIGANVGFEQDGKHELFERPLLIIKVFNKEIFWAVPITTKDKSGKYYFPLNHRDKKYSVILSQLRLFSSKRLLRKIRMISEDEFTNIRSKIKDLL